MAQFPQFTNEPDDFVSAEDMLEALSLAGHPPVRAATTAALPANTRTGNVLTANANGALAAQDGVTLAVDDDLLVWHEATGANRGIYVVTSLGAAGTPWSLTRRNDFDTSDKVAGGAQVRVSEGTLYGGGAAVLATNDPIALNTTALTFVLYQMLAIDSSGNLTLASALKMLPDGTAPRQLNFGLAYGAAAVVLFDDGPGNRYGWGLNASEMQFFVDNGARISWNKGGDFQPSGTNEFGSLTDAGVLNVVGSYQVDGVQVVGNQGAAIADADGTLADATRAINAILAQMRTDGKIAT